MGKLILGLGFGHVDYVLRLGHEVGDVLAVLVTFLIDDLELAFGRELGFSRDFSKTIREIHSLGQYLMYAFVVIHLCGVLIADITTNKGLVSGMINGNK